MDVRSPMFSNLALILAGVLFLNPIVATAAQLAVDGKAGGNTSLGQAGNGVPLVNIATPNGKGLSHNKFSDYNVGQQGLILNNATGRTQATQLGGIVLGNPNLQGKAAGMILNEVTGANPSHLRGYTEVAGQAARVIVANPHGITCDGCGFINTPRATLSTGRPIIEDGRLTRFDVDGGQIAIEGAGLNASNLEQFDLITRSAKINAELHASKLNIVTGRNQVDADSLAASAKADDGKAKPALAIDSSALGGMYAGAIRLVGTEAGVGVKLAGNLAASAGDIQVDAAGNLTLAQTAASGNLALKGRDVALQGKAYAGGKADVSAQNQLAIEQSLAAAGNVSLQGTQVVNRGVVEAGVRPDNSRAAADLKVSAQQVLNAGSLIGNRQLQVNASQKLDNQGGTLSGKTLTQIDAAQVDNRKGRILAKEELALAAGSVTNSDAGLITSAGKLDAKLGQLDNRGGELSSQTTAKLQAGSVDNRAGKIIGEQTLQLNVSGALNNQGGVLGANQQLQVNAGALDNGQQGRLSSQGRLDVHVAGKLDNQGQGRIDANGAASIQASSLDNRGGLLAIGGSLVIAADQLDNRQQGEITSRAGLDYRGQSLDNQGGRITAVGPLSLEAEVVQNSQGHIASQGNLNAALGSLVQRGGELLSQGSLQIKASSLDNRQDGLVSSTKNLQLDIGDIDNRGGELSSRAGVSLAGELLDNSGGRLLAGGSLALVVTRVINQAKGLLSSGGSLGLQAGRVDNQEGILSSAGDLNLNSAGYLDNRGGSIVTDAALDIFSSSLDNSQQGTLSSRGVARIVTGALDNSQGGSLTSGDTLNLKAGQVNNSGQGRIASNKDLIALVTGLDQRDGGELFSKADLSLNMQQGVLNNSAGGLINSPGQLLLQNLGQVINREGEISSQQGFTLATQQLDNSAGKLLSNQALVLRIAQALDNVKGMISARSLDLHAGNLNNDEGLLDSRGSFKLAVSGHLASQGGLVSASGKLDLTAASMDNRFGEVVGKGDIQASIGSLDQRGGLMIAQEGLTLEGQYFDNSANGLLSAAKGVTLHIDEIDNRGGEISSQESVQLTGKQLDNSDTGRLLAGTRLELAIERVINRSKGLISGESGLELDGVNLDNSGGALLSQQAVDITLGNSLTNARGFISSEGRLELSAVNLDNAGGSISSAGAMTLISQGELNNSGGQLVADGALSLISASLDNRQGVLSAKERTQVTTGQLDNSQGQLTSADALEMAAGRLINNGGRIGSGKALSVSVTSLEQQGGQLFSNAGLSLDLSGGDLDNRQGLINAPGYLLLKNLGNLNNQGGEISSQQAFTLAARGLDNSDGKVLSGQDLILRIDQVLVNLKGLIAGSQLDVRASKLSNAGGILTSRGDTHVDVSDSLQNDRQGLINASQQLIVEADTLDNRGGSLLAGTALDLSARSIDNRNEGLINSQGDLSLQGSTLDSSNAGEVSAKGAMRLALNQLIQRQGRLIGASSLSLDLNGGDLDNQSGLILAQGPLSLSRLRVLANQGGEISSSQSFALVLRNLDNSGGKLISSGQLDLSGAELKNQGGLLSGWQGLGVTGQRLDNRNIGTLSSRHGNLAVVLDGELLNGGEGALVSQGRLNVKATSLDNSDKGVLSSGGDQQLEFSQALNNSMGGQIDSAAALSLQAGNMNNTAGTLQAQQTLDLRATTLDNSGGSIAGNGATNLSLLGTFGNTNGKLASAGPLVLQGATQINNQGGQIASQGLLSLYGGSLDNRNQGTLAANGALLLSTTGVVQNANDGLIYSRDAGVRVESASLENSLGAIQAKGNLSIDTGSFANLQGRVLSQAGNLDIAAGNLDNRGGTLASLQGWVKARLNGWLNNDITAGKIGVVQGQSLDLTANSVTNRGGHLSALVGDALLATGSFDNSQGALYAKQLLKVTGNDLTNAGQIAAQRIDFSLAGALSNQQGIIESDTALTLTAAALNNQGGQLRALGQGGRTQLTVGGLLDNRSGTLEVANTHFGLAADSLQNVGGKLLHAGSGTFDISLPNVAGAGGSIVTLGGLTLNAGNWTNNSTIQAGRLTVNVGQFHQTASGQLLASQSFTGTGSNWSNDGLIASDGALGLSLSGTYSGSGRLTSLAGLGLSTAQLTLPTAGRISGGGNSVITVGGQLGNSGVMTSAGSLTVNAGTLNNYGTLGSAQQLRLVSSNLLNQNGLIFSGDDMTLRAGRFINRYADVYSLGSIDFAADDLGNSAALLSNRSGTMESVGSFSLRAALIENLREVLQYSDGGLYTAKIEENFCVEPGVDCSGKSNTWFKVTTRNKLEVTQASAAGLIGAGQNLSIIGGTLINDSSLISAGGGIGMTLSTLDNKGVETGETEVSRVYRLTRMDRKYQLAYVGMAETFTDTYWFESPGYVPSSSDEIASSISGFLSGEFDGEVAHLASTSQLAGGDQRYAGIIQAGGDVSINASNRINNGVVRPYQTYVSAGSKVGGTSTSGAGVSTNISFNSQLPPDLAQQQVNPLSLPGFSIPNGHNGLFRLSDTAASDLQGSQVEQGPASWTLGGASIGLAQREQVQADTRTREVQFDSSGQITLSSRQLEQGDRLPGAGAGAIQVEAGTALGGGVLPANRTAPQDQTIARVQGQPVNQVQSNAHRYLIETNPELTNLKQFMGSDYLLGNLGYDPDQAQKRLGDGLYEQRLVREAITARTGQRFLAGLTSDEAMYRYLMDNAIASKDRLGLSLGVSLSAAQVAALTHDIVWLEEHEVLGEKVLVPVLYLAQAEGRLAGNGALIQGRDVTLISGGDLLNQGTLRASGSLNAIAANIENSGLIEASERLQLLATDSIRNAQGGIIAGRDVSLTALTGDITNERSITTHTAATQAGNHYQTRDFVDSAARIEAANSLSLSAGRDLSSIGSVLSAGGDASFSAGRDLLIASATEVDRTDINVGKAQWHDATVTQYGSEVRVGGNLDIQAGRDLAVIASRVGADGNLSLAAGRDLDITSAANESHYEAHYKSSSKQLDIQRDQVSHQASEIVAGGSLIVTSGNDLTLTASRLEAGNEAYLYAGNDLSLLAAEDSAYESIYQQKKKRGTFSSSSKATYNADGSTSAVGSLVSANTVQMQAGHDINVSGSAVASTEHTRLLAGNDVTIDSATESHFSEHFQQKKKSGLMSSGGIGVMLGSTSTAATQKNTSETAKASTIGSILGNVDIQAGKNLTIQGSDVVAGQNINLIGENVNILAAQEQSRNEQAYKSKSSGLTLALSGAVGSAINTAYETSRQARDEEDGRLAALQGVKAGLTGVQAWQAVEQAGGLDSGNVGELVGISLSLGSQKSSSQQVQEQSISQGSSLSAGNNLNIIATGQGQVGEDGDIRIQGSQLKAGQDMTLAANRDILLEAAANTQQLDGKNKSSGGAVGVSFGVGSNGAGPSIFASGNQGSGREKGNGTIWTETTLDAGQQVSLISGRDTSLIGAQVSGEQITANVGRDLTLRSLQDSDEYDSRQNNVSAGASLGAGGGANFSASHSKIESDYRSVQEQTGLFAGKGGFQIDVGNHTQLDGAVIASTADADNNRLGTGTLGWSDIRNEAEYSSQHQGVGISSGGDVGGQFLGNLANGMLVGVNNGDDASSTTHSAISEGTLEIRDAANQRQDVAELSRDVENANNALSPIFDKEKEQRRLQQVQLIGEIGAQTMDIIRTQGDIEASKKAREELAKAGNHNPTAEEIRNSAIYQDEMSRYGTGSDLQRAAQAVTAALQGLSGGDLGSALAGASAPYLANVIKHSTAGNDEARLMAHAVLGAVVAQAQGGSAAAGAAGAAVGELIAASLYPNKNPKNLTESEKQTVSALSTLAAGLAGAAVGGDAAGALAGAQGGKNAVENNYLSPAQEVQKEKELEECQDRFRCKFGTEAKWSLISAQQDVGLIVGVGGGIGLSAAETAEGIYELATNFKEVVGALKLLADSPEFRQQFSDSYFADLEQRAELLTQAYNDAGWDGSVTAGVEGGRFAVELVGLITVVRGAAQVTAKLPSAAKVVVNAIAEAPASGGWRAQAGAVGDLSKLKVPGGENRTFDFTSSGAGNDLRRFTTLDGTDVRINSGHAYNRTHAGGDVSKIGTMDEIENAILRDISANSRLGSLQPRTTQTHTVQVNGQTVGYSLADTPVGANINYYPAIE